MGTKSDKNSNYLVLREKMLARRKEILRDNPNVHTSEEMAKLMGDLEGTYWDWQLENFLKKGSA